MNFTGATTSQFKMILGSSLKQFEDYLPMEGCFQGEAIPHFERDNNRIHLVGKVMTAQGQWVAVTSGKAFEMKRNPKTGVHDVKVEVPTIEKAPSGASEGSFPFVDEQGNRVKVVFIDSTVWQDFDMSFPVVNGVVLNQFMKNNCKNHVSKIHPTV